MADTRFKQPVSRFWFKISSCTPANITHPLRAINKFYSPQPSFVKEGGFVIVQYWRNMVKFKVAHLCLRKSLTTEQTFHTHYTAPQTLHYNTIIQLWTGVLPQSLCEVVLFFLIIRTRVMACSTGSCSPFSSRDHFTVDLLASMRLVQHYWMIIWNVIVTLWGRKSIK